MIYRYHYPCTFQIYKKLIHVHCSAHILDLAGHDAMDMLQASLDFLVRHSYNWFAHSVTRQNAYWVTFELVGFASISEILQEEEGEENSNSSTALADKPIGNPKKYALKLLSPSLTRWLVICDCIERILRQVRSAIIINY